MTELTMAAFKDCLERLEIDLALADLANATLETALNEKNARIAELEAELAELRELVGTHEPENFALKALDSLFPGDSERLQALTIKGKVQ